MFVRDESVADSNENSVANHLNMTHDFGHVHVDHDHDHDNVDPAGNFASFANDPIGNPATLGDDTTQLVLRALVSTKEAGVIIGKDGATVAGLRDAAKVKAGVTKSVAGIPDRILSVAGTAAGVSRAIGLAAAALVAHPPSGYVLNLVPPGPQGTTTVRLLIPHQRMGSILGKGGVRIKAIKPSTACALWRPNTGCPTRPSASSRSRASRWRCRPPSTRWSSVCLKKRTNQSSWPTTTRAAWRAV